LRTAGWSRNQKE